MPSSPLPSLTRPDDCNDLPLLLVVIAALTAWRALAIATSGLDLYVDEAQYWTWSQALDWGYFSKPPMIAAVIAATTAVCGDSALCVKSGALLLYPFTTLLIWAISRRLFDARTAFWTAVVFITLPGVALSSVIISTDVPLFLCWSAALYAYLKALDTDAWRWWLAAGVASGLGLLTKYTMAIFAVSVVLHLAITPGLRPQLRGAKLYVTAALAALIFAPNLVWNAANGWPTLGHTAQISGLEGGLNGGQHGLNWKSFGDFVAGQLGILGPVLFIAWLVQLAAVKHWIRDERYRLLACFALPFLGAITAQSLIGRANANWAAMAYVGGTIFVVAKLLEQQRIKLLAGALALNLTVTVIAYHYDALAHAAGIELTRNSDVLNKRVRGWRQYGEALAARQAAHPEAILLGDARDLIAEARFYAGPAGRAMLKWNPERKADDYYAMSTTLDGLDGRSFVFVSREATLPASMAGRFETTTELEPIHIAIHRDYALDFHVWRLSGFRERP
ncbi:MAG: glycosyl transferase family 39 [Xanthomonadaceae bacterium]|nr:glycosyl transferase family 39 [Xanthomonadaceae bacterium]